eukprot:6376745-Prymnesium_polylepis.2
MPIGSGPALPDAACEAWPVKTTSSKIGPHSPITERFQVRGTGAIRESVMTIERFVAVRVSTGAG